MTTINAVFHVDQNDRATFQLALSNIKNLLSELGELDVSAELVANGEGIRLLLDKDNDLKQSINDLAAKGVRLLACEKAMKRYEVERPMLLARVTTIPAGVVQLVKRQHEGWAYVKP